MTSINDKLGLRRAGKRAFMANLPKNLQERAAITSAECPGCHRRGKARIHPSKGDGWLWCTWCSTTWARPLEAGDVDVIDAEADSMKRLSPGVYDDEQGGLHLDVRELLTAAGYADTLANRAQLIAAAEAMFGAVTVTGTPVARWDDTDTGGE